MTESNNGWSALCREATLPSTWTGRCVWALTGAAIWVALEMLLARILGGFPWNLLGASQYRMIPLIQICSVTGIYGLSFLIVWTSLGLILAGVMVCRERVRRSAWVPEVILPMLAVAIAFNVGFRQLRPEAPPGRTLRMALVQPSIPQTLIWDSARDEERFRELLNLSERALTNGVDVLVWPEAAVPKLLRYDKETYEEVTGLARRFHTWMIIGADDAEPRLGSAKSNDADYFNGSFLINPDGKLENAYRKRNLVVFGEFIPFQRWMPFLKYFTPIEGGYTPGTRSVQFDLGNLGVKTSVLICFEDTFPQLARADAQDDTDFLVNLTNNGWFDESAAQWQHATSALFRAVENGVPLVRCANHGLTCWADAHGRLREIFQDGHGTIYGPGFLAAEIPLLPLGTHHARTFYGRHGDWFGWACVGAALLMVLGRLFMGKRSGQANDLI